MANVDYARLNVKGIASPAFFRRAYAENNFDMEDLIPSHGAKWG
jgi:hypothetical protein